MTGPDELAAAIYEAWDRTGEPPPRLAFDAGGIAETHRPAARAYVARLRDAPPTPKEQPA